jgi:hypothetical protein
MDWAQYDLEATINSEFIKKEYRNWPVIHATKFTKKNVGSLQRTKMAVQKATKAIL